jgi:hypothetical protein
MHLATPAISCRYCANHSRDTFLRRHRADLHHCRNARLERAYLSRGERIEDRLLARKVLIERANADPGHFRHCICRDDIMSALFEQPNGRFQYEFNLLEGPLLTRNADPKWLILKCFQLVALSGGTRVSECE